jgi:hypothetical protein
MLLDVPPMTLLHDAQVAQNQILTRYRRITALESHPCKIVSYKRLRITFLHKTPGGVGPALSESEIPKMELGSAQFTKASSRLCRNRRTAGSRSKPIASWYASRASLPFFSFVSKSARTAQYG